ncbi:unnamed protein product [Adineta steineri]|uniref:Uncharacterized protein n=1 Tax=Adineta steineri TaxID=433720 RepID=A0A813PM54_9BILA|nr:unnamed protein product [Adineta steineri]CAF3789635.1 unnamed protein product [Adineta steineri]
MYAIRLKKHRFPSMISLRILSYHERLHICLFFIIIFIASLISYYQPYSLLFNFKNIVFEPSSIESIRNNVLHQHKQQQQIAYEWLDNLLKNPKNYPHLISNYTQQIHFYDYIQMKNNLSSSSYTLLNKPKQILLNTTDHIVISILYGQQDTDHREGKFYIGQMLYHLLKNYHSRFIITLCENNNTNEQVSDGINLIRQILPVFIVNTKSQTIINTYEREKEAHLQCLLANFQSFPSINYLLLLQDDAEPISKNFYYQLLSLIDNRIKQRWPLNGHRQQPAFIKIYHPRWLISYIYPSIYMITQLISTSFLLTFVGFYSYQFIIHFSYFKKNTNIKQQEREREKYFRSLLNNNIFLSKLINLNLVYFIFYFILIILVLILIDHSNVSWTWRSLHPSFYSIYPAPSCCLPGVLYFQQTSKQIIDYLNHTQCHSKYAIDTALDDLPARTNLQTFLVEPNLVHHIGLYSRLRRMYINPYLLD